MDDTYVIYKHTSPSGKSYIGQTKDYDRRCWQHQNRPGCRALNSSIKKYGWDNFQHELIMEGLSLEAANHWETVLIVEHNTLAPNGYNLRTGGANSSPSDETRSKMSSAKLGKPLSEDHKASISASRQNLSDEAKANMSASKMGNTYRLGVHHTDEAKVKISKANKGKKRSEEATKKIVEAHRGKKRTDETKAKMSASKLGKKRGPMSTETKNKISIAAKSRAAARKNISDTE
jgi:group I intron endonuclease